MLRVRICTKLSIGNWLRRHGVDGFRDRSQRLALMDFLGLGLAVAGSSARTVNQVQLAVIASLFAHSRDEEREATLSRYAEALRRNSRHYRLGRKAHRHAIAAIRDMLWADQLDLERCKRTEWLIASFIAEDGKRPDYLCYEAELHRRRGGPRHAASARRLYREALLLGQSAMTGVPAMCWRGYGQVAWKLGTRDEARRAFRRYLELRPHAPDRAMIAFYLQDSSAKAPAKEAGP